MLRLKLFGTPSILAGEQRAGGRAAQRHRLALLALIAQHATGVSRDKLLALLWPDRDAERARNSLNESIYVLRKELGEDLLLSHGSDLQLNRAHIEVDVLQFEAALDREEWPVAVAYYAGPFMDGFFLSAVPEFEQWLEGRRSHLARRHHMAIERLATAALAARDPALAAEWWRRLAETDPYDTRVALQLIESLAAAGNRAAALEHARIHGLLLRTELGIEPDPQVEAIAANLRAEPTPHPQQRSAALGSASRNGDTALGALPISPQTPAPDVHATHRSRTRFTRATFAIGATLLVVATLAALQLRSRRAPVNDSITIAALPFRMLSNQPADMFLSIGVPDAITTRLSGIHPALRVRPTSVVLAAQPSSTNLHEAARALAAGYLVTGAVQRRGAHLVVSVQLVDVDREESVWGHEYIIRSDDLLGLQDSIAAGLADALSLPLEIRHAAHRANRPTANRVAYERYLQGRVHLARHREADTRAALRLFESALARDSAFAFAHAGIAIASAEMHLRFASKTDAPTWGDRAIAAARTALAMEPRLAEVHEALAAVYRKSEFDWQATIEESRRAIELDSGLAMPHFFMAGALYHLGLLEQAERAVRAGLDLPPGTDRVEALRTLGTIALARGRHGEAIALFQDVQRLSDREVSGPNLAAAYFYAGDTELAERLLSALARGGTGSAASRARATLASFVAARGDSARAGELLKAAERGVMDHHVAYSMGAAFAQLRKPADALRWLRIAAETGFRCYPWFARDPLLAPLHQNREFVAFMSEQRRRWEVERKRYEKAI